MLVHIDPTVVHIFDVKNRGQTETKLFKANVLCKEPIRVCIEVYVPKKKI